MLLLPLCYYKGYIQISNKTTDQNDPSLRKIFFLKNFKIGLRPFTGEPRLKKGRRIRISHQLFENEFGPEGGDEKSWWNERNWEGRTEGLKERGLRWWLHVGTLMGIEVILLDWMCREPAGIGVVLSMWDWLKRSFINSRVKRQTRNIAKSREKERSSHYECTHLFHLA